MLSQRPSSDGSQSLAEEDALLTGARTGLSEQKRGWKFWREIGLFAWATLATAAVIVLAVVYQKHQTEAASPAQKIDGKRNLIFMVSDGMGPTSLSMTRSFRQFRDGLPVDDTLVLDKHLIGQSRTRSSSSLVTDSAAGATAFSCGLKSYNGAISVDPNHDPCGTVLEAAKKAGYMTGLVVTTRITDATPACFAAHVNMRSEEDRIAEQMVGDYPLGRVVDIMLGGGRCHFLPNGTDGSCRGDDRDIVELAGKNGFDYISTREEFDNLDGGNGAKLPLLGLFAETDIPYEIDRRKESDTYPSLDEMARFALTALSAATDGSDKGFFIMIEGSRIDHAGHGNDPAAQVLEVLAYDDAVSSVLEFLENDDTPGIMVSTSDHETGGLAAARQLDPDAYPEYLWYPEVLANTSSSAERVASLYHDHLESESKKGDELKDWLIKLIADEQGIHDASDEELTTLIDKPDGAPVAFADMTSRRAQIGWSTHGHSAADVNIFTSDPAVASDLRGNHENIEVGQFLAHFLDVDVKAVTRELREKGMNFDFEQKSWLGALPQDGERLDGQDHLKHYEGDFKKRHAHRCSICGV